MSLTDQDGGPSCLLSLTAVILFAIFSQTSCLATSPIDPLYDYDADSRYSADTPIDYTEDSYDSTRDLKTPCGPQSNCIRPEMLGSKLKIEHDFSNEKLSPKIVNILSRIKEMAENLPLQ